MTPLFPLGICNKSISNTHKFVKCTICNYKIHIKCNKADESSCKKNKKNSDPVFCLNYEEEIVPFKNLSDGQFYMTKCLHSDVDQLKLLPNNSDNIIQRYK